MRVQIAVSVFALALGAPFSVPVQPDLPEPFELNSTASTYPFVMRLNGTVQQHGDSLIIQVDSGLVRSQIPLDLGADGLATNVAVAFALGYQDGDGWNSSRDTPTQFVADSLGVGQTRPVQSMQFVITGLDTVLVADRWLVAELSVDQHLPGVQAGRMASYACATENLAGATPASRSRAERMAAAYSHTC